MENTEGIITSPVEPYLRRVWRGQGPVVARVKVGRNKLCPCGSGQKFKRCCLEKVTENPYVTKPKM